MSLMLARNPRGQAVQYARHPNLVGWWRMEGNLRDSSGNGNHGTVGAGSEAYGAGVFGRAWDGDDTRYIMVPSTNDLNTGESLTLSGWVNPDSIQDMELISKRNNFNNQNSYSFRLVTSGAFLNLYYVSGSPAGTGVLPPFTFLNSNIQINHWTHVCLTRQGVSVSVYINGIFLSSVTDAISSLFASTSPVLIGAVNSSNPALRFNGLLDDIRIYNCALTPDDIRRVMAGQQATGDYS